MAAIAKSGIIPIPPALPEPILKDGAKVPLAVDCEGAASVKLGKGTAMAQSLSKRIAISAAAPKSAYFISWAFCAAACCASNSD